MMTPTLQRRLPIRAYRSPAYLLPHRCQYRSGNGSQHRSLAAHPMTPNSRPLLFVSSRHELSSPEMARGVFVVLVHWLDNAEWWYGDIQYHGNSGLGLLRAGLQRQENELVHLPTVIVSLRYS